MKLMLTPDDLAAAFTRLRAIYGLKGAWALQDPDADEAVAFRREWLTQLNAARVQPAELVRAIDTWLSESQKGWPTPGDIRRLVYGAYRSPTKRGPGGSDFAPMVWCEGRRPDGSTFQRCYPADAIPRHVRPIGEAA